MLKNTSPAKIKNFIQEIKRLKPSTKNKLWISSDELRRIYNTRLTPLVYKRIFVGLAFRNIDAEIVKDAGIVIGIRVWLNNHISKERTDTLLKEIAVDNPAKYKPVKEDEAYINTRISVEAKDKIHVYAKEQNKSVIQVYAEILEEFADKL